MTATPHFLSTQDLERWIKLRSVLLVLLTALAVWEAGWPMAIAPVCGAALFALLGREGVPRIPVTIAALALIGLGSPVVALFLPVVVAETFWALPLRQAVVTVTVVFGVALVSIFAHAASPHAWALAPLALGYLLSIAAAVWISQILEVTKQRTEALEELRRSQKELAELSRIAGIETERARIAQEVHDGVTQRLALIRMLLDSASDARTAADDARQRTHLAYVESGESLKELRSLLARTDTDEAPDNDAEFARGVRAAAASVTAASGLSVETDFAQFRHGEELPLRLRSTATAFIRTALTNTVEHSGADRARITVLSTADHIVVRVEDDGVGMPPTTVARPGPGHGFGLRSSRERIEGLGGRLSIGESTDGGALVEAEFPLVGTSESERS